MKIDAPPVIDQHEAETLMLYHLGLAAAHFVGTGTDLVQILERIGSTMSYAPARASELFVKSLHAYYEEL